MKVCTFLVGLSLLGCTGALQRIDQPVTNAAVPLNNEEALVRGADGTYVASQFTSISPAYQRDPSFQVAVGNIGRIISVMSLQAQFQALQLQAAGRVISRQGSILTYWGNRKLPLKAPEGSEIVYTGWGFGPNVFYHSREIECIQDRGNAGESTATLLNLDYVFPVLTEKKELLPPTIQDKAALACTVVRVPSNTVVIKGNDTCPASWSLIYSGFVLGSTYNGTTGFNNGAANSLCVVDGPEFDFSIREQASTSYSYVTGTQTKNGPVLGMNANNLWMKCAVCGKD